MKPVMWQPLASAGCARRPRRAPAHKAIHMPPHLERSRGVTRARSARRALSPSAASPTLPENRWRQKPKAQFEEGQDAPRRRRQYLCAHLGWASTARRSTALECRRGSRRDAVAHNTSSSCSATHSIRRTSIAPRAGRESGIGHRHSAARPECAGRHRDDSVLGHGLRRATCTL